MVTHPPVAHFKNFKFLLRTLSLASGEQNLINGNLSPHFITDFWNIAVYLQNLSRTGFYNCITVQWMGFTAKSVGYQGAVIWYLGHWVTLERCDNNEIAHPCIFTGLFFLRCFLTPHISLQHSSVIVWGHISPSCFTEGLCSFSAGLPYLCQVPQGLCTCYFSAWECSFPNLLVGDFS